MFPRLLPALLSLPVLFAAAPAHAAQITLGSDLSAPATITETHGTDTAFWPITVAGQSFTIPEDGQVLSVKVKGAVLKQQGAADPATLIHIQSLEPAATDGSRQVYLSSQGFDMPIAQPGASTAAINQVTTFTPENLCVHKDGAVAFNDIGGFRYGGSLDAPIDPDVTHYPNGAPFQIFAAVPSSTTARFSANDQTKNGDVLSTSTANQNDAAGPVGMINRGEELLMQVVLATGDDRSQSCGGPRRNPDGSLVVHTPPPTAMHIRDQKAYVSSNRSLAPTAFCPSGVPSCVGTATLTYKGKKIASAKFTAPSAKTAHIPMKLTPAAYKTMKKAKGSALRVTFTIVTSIGTYTQLITIRH
ncbi:MAG: hypothetical protein JWM71_2475 [Solirubrobacteraceae bacterium]|nr:hypothetical protein [Solirubrobacteraceae bacterium]